MEYILFQHIQNIKWDEDTHTLIIPVIHVLPLVILSFHAFKASFWFRDLCQRNKQSIDIQCAYVCLCVSVCVCVCVCQADAIDWSHSSPENEKPLDCERTLTDPFISRSEEKAPVLTEWKKSIKCEIGCTSLWEDAPSWESSYCTSSIGSLQFIYCVILIVYLLCALVVKKSFCLEFVWIIVDT